MRLGAHRARLDAPPARDAPEVVAREVDDHHVLGRVLGGGEQRLGARLARRGALDRRGDDLVAGPAQEQLGRERQHRAAPAEVEERAVAGLERGGGRQVGVGRAAAQRAFEPQRQVGLEQLAGRDPLHARRDRRQVAPERAGRGLQPVERERPRLARGAQPRPQLLQPRQRRLVERLEPPRPVRVLAQHVVVEAEARGRQRHGPRRRGRQPLDRRAEPVPEEAEPAAADALAVPAAAVLEHVEHRGALHHAPGRRADDRARARPVARQRERARVVADGAQHVGDGRFELERDPQQGHPPSVA